MKVSNQSIPKIEGFNSPLLPILYGKGDKVPCRDPFIMPYDGRYYLYKSYDKKGIGCLISSDLEQWSNPVMVFTPPEDFHGTDDFFWAPECHFFNGWFYIFTSVFSKLTNHRSISVYRSKSPLGPFEDIAGGCITPRDWDTIDGTLYVDKKGQPWMVFVHEWTSMPDHNGSMVAARLSEDFTRLVTEPIHLFYAKDAKWAAAGITDGCFMYRTDEERLLMIWSNVSQKGYAMGIASSDNGEIDGKWTQQGLLYDKDLHPSFEKDGGHGMIFRKFDGSFAIAFHSPNSPTPDGEFEHLVIKQVKEEGGLIKIIP